MPKTDTTVGVGVIVCSNCGRTGHVYRSCTYPVTSYGIMCFRLVEDKTTNSVKPEFLMVQRKDSLGFVEFVRGKYDVNDTQYIGALLTNMTVSERDMLLCDGGNMEYLWSYLWRDLSTPSKHILRRRGEISFTKDFEDARTKFDCIKGSLPSLLDKFPSEISETDWGFPKGRRNMSESDIDCALREFHEETGLNSKHLRITKDRTYVNEMFQGSNGVWYKHVYFVAKAMPRMAATCDENGKYQHCNGEIRSVGWFNFEDCIAKIRPAYPQRRYAVENVNAAIIDSMKNACIAAVSTASDDGCYLEDNSRQSKECVMFV